MKRSTIKHLSLATTALALFSAGVAVSADEATAVVAEAVQTQTSSELKPAAGEAGVASTASSEAATSESNSQAIATSEATSEATTETSSEFQNFGAAVVDEAGNRIISVDYKGYNIVSAPSGATITNAKGEIVVEDPSWAKAEFNDAYKQWIKDTIAKYETGQQTSSSTQTSTDVKDETSSEFQNFGAAVIDEAGNRIISVDYKGYNIVSTSSGATITNAKGEVVVEDASWAKAEFNDAYKQWIKDTIAKYEAEQQTSSSTESSTDVKDETETSETSASETAKSETSTSEATPKTQATAEETELFKNYTKDLKEADYYYTDLNNDGVNELVTKNGVFFITNGEVKTLAGSVVAPVGGYREAFKVVGSYIASASWSAGSGDGVAEIRVLRADGSGYDIIAKEEFTKFGRDFDFDKWVDETLANLPKNPVTDTKESSTANTTQAATKESKASQAAAKTNTTASKAAVAQTPTQSSKKLPSTGEQNTIFAAFVGAILSAGAAILAKVKFLKK